MVSARCPQSLEWGAGGRQYLSALKLETRTLTLNGYHLAPERWWLSSGHLALLMS